MRLVATSLMVECGVPFSLTDADETRQARKQSWKMGCQMSDDSYLLSTFNKLYSKLTQPKRHEKFEQNKKTRCSRKLTYDTICLYSKLTSRYEGESVSVADSRRRRTAVSCSPRQSIWSTTFLTVSLVTARDWCIARRSLEWRLYVVTSRIRSKEVSRTG
jgi:hypothetical protein